MQSVRISLSLQYCSNSSEWWLSCPSSTRRRYLPCLRALVNLSKCLIHITPSSFDVQPFSLTAAMTQSGGNGLSWYQERRCVLPLTMRNGGMLQPWELAPIIAESHSRLPGWISLTCPRISEDVTILVVKIWPIKNPVSSKL